MKNERESFREKKAEGMALLGQGGAKVGFWEAELISLAQATGKGWSRSGRS